MNFTDNFNEDTTLGEWLVFWLETYVLPTAKPSGYEHYYDNCHKHIIPVIGDVPLGNLTPSILQRFFNEKARTGNLRTGGPLSTKSLRNMRAVLDVALKIATALEYMPSNPVPLTAIKSVRSRRVEIMTNTMQNKLEQHLFRNYSNKNVGILFALYTGMRLGEICALKFKNYDEHTKMLHVDTTVKRLPTHSQNPADPKTQLVFNDVKTTSSERDLYMPPVLQSVIQKQKVIFAKNFGRKATGEDFIIFSRVGTVMEPDNLSHHFSATLKKLDMDHVKFHAIRHTFATGAIEKGIDVATVSGLLGHADVTTTTHYYVHPRDEAMRKAMKQVAPISWLDDAS
ncbi:MAG: site-specific integrase [Faecalibacterium sp.]